MKDRSARYFLTVALIILLLSSSLLMTTGCSTLSFYGQAVSGHLSLMHRRQKISELLDNPQTDPAVAEKLRLAQEIIEFAGSQLQLDSAGSYRQVVITGQPAVSWNVVAAGEFSVEPRLWCFPIAGCVPYRGYFKQKQALEFAGQVKAEGFDVDVSPVTAYSTLGWFNDPLLDTMLNYPDSQLAAVLIHELAHQKLYIAGDTPFNEAFAEFVESVGVKDWLQQTGRQQELADWLAKRRAEPQFTELLAETRATLNTLYGSGENEDRLREQKQATFQTLRNAYSELVAEQWQGRNYFGGWLEGELNNARLALAASYAGGACAFASLYRQAGEELEDFYLLAEQKSMLDMEQRQAWLQAPCNSFASASNL